MRTGFVGVVSTRATPAFQQLAGSAATSEPRPSRMPPTLKKPKLLMMFAIFRFSLMLQPCQDQTRSVQALLARSPGSRIADRKTSMNTPAP